MKKITQLVGTACMAVLLFSVGMAHAQTVNFDDPLSPTKATSIDGFILNGTTYDVTFITGSGADASLVYGDFPGEYQFDQTEAGPAVVAMNALLNAAGALKIGNIGGLDFQNFRIGFESFLQIVTDIESCNAAVGKRTTGDWGLLSSEASFYNIDDRQWAFFTETGLGVDDEIFGASISVYPNPTDNVVHIKTNANITSISIFDITGKVILNSQFKVGESTTLDLSAFNAGMYLLKLEDDKGRVSIKKILVQ